MTPFYLLNRMQAATKVIPRVKVLTKDPILVRLRHILFTFFEFVLSLNREA
jgi:hypothetical protein